MFTYVRFYGDLLPGNLEILELEDSTENYISCCGTTGGYAATRWARGAGGCASSRDASCPKSRGVREVTRKHRRTFSRTPYELQQCQSEDGDARA